MKLIKTIISKFTHKSHTKLDPSLSVYDIKINTLQGKPLDLNAFRGKFILFVNVASKCGFTPQYKTLEKLSNEYKDKLEVIGVPCNQFGKQEPGNANEIKSFCEINYGVTFTITEKINVKGIKQHNLYKWLTTKQLNKKNDSIVLWNFQKYLVNPKGEFVDYYFSNTKPFHKNIIKHIQ